MKILAFDTTAAIESVAILIDNEVVLVKELQQRSSAAEILTSNIAEIMAQQKLQFSDLDAIAVTRGPASFTSVRIGLSCAKGLALATGKKLLTFDSLLVQAYSYRSFKGRIAIVVDAKMDEYFIANFIANGQDLVFDQESRLVSGSELSKIAVEDGQIVAGSGSNDLLLANSIKKERVVIENEDGEQSLAGNLALMAVNCQDLAVTESAPNYIRSPKIGIRKK